MSTKTNLSKPHKCLFANCKGTLLDPPESYGKYAYWWGDTVTKDQGWHNKPKY
jgi:hypothetical protein